MFYQNYDEQLYIETQKLLVGNYDMCKNFTNLSADFVYKILYDTVGEFLTKKRNPTREAVMDELIKESYIQIFNNMANLREPRAFYMWATRIVTGVALKYIQKNNFEIISFEDESSNKNISFDRASDDKEAFLSKDIISDRSKLLVIHEKIMELSDLHHIVAQYFYYANMTIKDISETMNCSQGAVKSRINDIRNVIKNIIKEESTIEDEPTMELKSLSEVPLVWMAFRESILTIQDKQSIQRAHYIADIVGTNATKKGITEEAFKIINKTLGVNVGVTEGRIVEAPEEKKSGKKILAVILVVVVLIVLGSVFGILLKLKENKSDDKDDSVSVETSTEENSLSESEDVTSTEQDETEEQVTEETVTEEAPSTDEDLSSEEGVPNAGEGSNSAETPNVEEDVTTEETPDTTEDVPAPEDGNQGASSNNLDDN